MLWLPSWDNTEERRRSLGKKTNSALRLGVFFHDRKNRILSSLSGGLLQGTRGAEQTVEVAAGAQGGLPGWVRRNMHGGAEGNGYCLPLYKLSRQ